MYVYLLETEGFDFFKIGITGNLDKRLSTIQTHCPFKVNYKCYTLSEMPQAFETELHLEFSDYRIQGEWFKLNEELLEKCVDKIKHHNNEWCELKELWDWIPIMDFGSYCVENEIDPF